jgi:hypothetical protein
MKMIVTLSPWATVMNSGKNLSCALAGSLNQSILKTLFDGATFTESADT